MLILYILHTLSIDSPLAVLIIFYGSPFQLTLNETIKNDIVIVGVFTFLQLLLSGDVESNPGPNVQKDCPICNKVVPIRSKSCSSCGFKFNKQVRGVSKSWNLSSDTTEIPLLMILLLIVQ